MPEGDSTKVILKGVWCLRLYPWLRRSREGRFKVAIRGGILQERIVKGNPVEIGGEKTDAV